MVIQVIKTFLFNSSVYSCHLSLIFCASLRFISFLSFIVSIFAWNVPLIPFNFPEEISSLSHSIVFFYFFALFTSEGFLISPYYSLELCIQMAISFLFPFAFRFPSFHNYLPCSKTDSNYPLLTGSVQSPLHNLYHNLVAVHISFSVLHDVTSSCNKSWFSPTDKLSSCFVLPGKPQSF